MHGSPYFVINFDENNDTEGVTSGKSKTQKITYITRSKNNNFSSSTKFKKLVNLILELEEITGSLVDIEFGSQNNKLNTFHQKNTKKMAQNKNESIDNESYKWKNFK